MTPEATRAHGTYADYVRWSAGLDDRAAVLDDAGVLAVAMSSDWPDTRLCLVVDDEVAPEAWAARADGFLSDHGRCAAAFLRLGADDAHRDQLLARGYHELEQVPEMRCGGPLPHREEAPGITVRLAADADDITAYAAVAGSAFADIGLLEESTRELLDNPTALLGDDVVVAVGELDGSVVAGALVVLVGDGRAYVSYVSVRGDARGRRLGDAVTRRVTNEAFGRGAREVTLEASTYGEGTYRRMGYEELYRYRIMVRV